MLPKSGGGGSVGVRNNSSDSSSRTNSSSSKHYYTLVDGTVDVPAARGLLGRVAWRTPKQRPATRVANDFTGTRSAKRRVLHEHHFTGP